MTSLFRQQVVDEQRSRLHGEVLLLPKTRYTVILCCILFWVTACMVWAWTSTYARKERVMGWVEPEAGVINLYASGAGIIEEIMIGDGDSVSAGQPLIVVSDDRMLSGGSHVGSILAQELSSQNNILRERLVQTEEAYRLRLLDTEQQIEVNREDLRALESQIETVMQRFQISRSQLNNITRLRESGHVSSVEWDEARQQTLLLQSDRQTLVREKNSKIGRIKQLENQKSLLPIEKNDALDDINAKLSANSQEVAQLHGQRSHVVYAPRAGIVTNLQARLGQKASAGVPLLSVTPQASELRLQLLVPVSAIGFVVVGQQLEVRYDAFPYEKFGLYSGQITDVSQTVLLPGEVMNGSLAPSEPVYRVAAKLEQDYVNAYGNRVRLRSGMTVSADIRLGERTLMEWLLEPIYSLRGSL